MNNVKIVYYSKYYNIQNFVDFYLANRGALKVENDGSTSLEDTDRCILILPTYEPEYLVPVFKFMEKYQGQVVGLVGSGDRNYGGLYLYSAFEIELEYGVPVLGGFENLGMPDDAEALDFLLNELNSKGTYTPPDMSHTEFYDINVDRENYLKYKKERDVEWQNPIKKK